MATDDTARRERSAPASGWVRRVLGFHLLLAAIPASAGGWQLTPKLEVAETFSSNMALSANNEKRGWISVLSPGLQVNGTGPRLKGYLDFRRDFLFYQGAGEWNHQQNHLRSRGTFEAVNDHLFLDADATIQQYRFSPFGNAAAGTANFSTNRVEVRDLVVSPYWRGQIGNSADYVLKYSFGDRRYGDGTVVNTKTRRFVGSARSSGNAAVGWFSDVILARLKNDQLGDLRDDRLRAGVFVPLGQRLRVSLATGRERSDFVLGTETQSLTTPTVGFEWSDGKQAQMAGLREKRFFGYGHNVLLAYRTPLTAWRYVDNKDVGGSILQTKDGLGTVYDLMAQLLDGSILDPTERARAVQGRTDAMAGNSTLGSVDGVATARPYVERLQEGSLALLGRRDTLTMLLRQRYQNLLFTSGNVADGFADTTRIRDRSASLTWSHKLTPNNTLSLSYGYLRSSAMDGTSLESTQGAQSVALGFQLSPKTVASFAIRHSRLDGELEGDARESALVGTLIEWF